MRVTGWPSSETRARTLTPFGACALAEDSAAAGIPVTTLGCATAVAANEEPLDAEADGPEVAVEHDNPETILMRLTDSKALQSAIDGLPVHHREILLLCEVEEMSYQEIAESLSIPIGTVMSRLSRARKTLRDVLRLQFQKG